MEDLAYILNELLSKVRAELEYTQYEMAEKLNCSQELISKIENKNREMSYDLMFSLANISKMDFHYYRYISSKFKNKDDYNLFYEISTIVDSDYLRDIDVLENKLITSCATERLTYGEPRALVRYSEAIIQYYKYRDYDKVVDIFLEAVTWEEQHIGEYNIYTLKAGYYYGLFTMVIKAYIKLRKIDTAMKMCEKFFHHTEEVWDKEHFKLATANYLFRKFYISIYVDYMSICLEIGRLDEVIRLSDITLELCSDLNILQPIKFILRWKVEALCKANMVDDAQKIFLELKTICKYSDLQNQFVEIINVLVKRYPNYLSNVE